MEESFTLITLTNFVSSSNHHTYSFFYFVKFQIYRKFGKLVQLTFTLIHHSWHSPTFTATFESCDSSPLHAEVYIWKNRVLFYITKPKRIIKESIFKFLCLQNIL